MSSAHNYIVRDIVDGLTVTSLRAIARVSHTILICQEHCVK